MTCSNTDIQITQRPLVQERLNWRKMAAIQDDVSADEYRAQLRSFAALGAVAVLAWDGDKVVGSMIWIPAERMRAVVETRDSLPCDLSKAIVPTCIYVDSAYEGQGISFRMEQAKFDQTAQLGYDLCIYYGFAAERIVGWVKHHKSCIDTGVDDPSGWRVHLVPIPNV